MKHSTPIQPPRRLTLTVGPEYAGQKVDVLLRRVLGLSGTVIRRAKWLPGGIALDGTAVYTSQPVRQGQVLSVLVGDTERRSGILSAPGELKLVYEDEDLVIVDKAPGMLVHPRYGHTDDTVGNFLLYHYDTEGLAADFHPVHRLDKGTSGLMAVAKHAHAQEVLKAALHTPDFRRLYLAVCEGTPSPAQGVVDAPIALLPGSAVKRGVLPGGPAARTSYEVLRTCAGRALLRLELFTGRTHQIRVHMAHLGHPLTGDFLYGTEDTALIPRPALHAAFLSLRHPVTREVLTFSSPLPEDIRRLIG